MEPISFVRGVPSPECLPVDELADCAIAAISTDGKTVLSYGAAGGYAPLREWIAERHGVEPERVVVTNGSLQGFVFLAGRLAPRGRACRAPAAKAPSALPSASLRRPRSRNALRGLRQRCEA